MTHSWTAGLFFCACVSTLGGGPPKGFELDSSALSPNGSIRIEHYANRADAGLANHLQIWVADARNPTNRALLYAHDRWAAAQASPDDAYIAVTDYMGSDCSEPFLFRRVKGVRYAAVTNADISALAWDAIARQYRIRTPFDHSYCEVSCWLGPHSILIHAWGHESGVCALEDWFTIYDIRTGRLHFDLRLANDVDVERVKAAPPPATKSAATRTPARHSNVLK